MWRAPHHTPPHHLRFLSNKTDKMAASSSSAGATLREAKQARSARYTCVEVRWASGTRGRASPEEAEDVPGGDVVPLLDDDEREQNGRGDMTAAVCVGEGAVRGGAARGLLWLGGDSRSRASATSNIVKPPKKPTAWTRAVKLSRAGGK